MHIAQIINMVMGQLKISYLSTSCQLKKQASNYRSQALGNPVQKTSNECYMATNEGTECNGRIYMPARNVSTD
jgi:hypothetical protein